ncbi:hypothetical protein ACHAWU_005249 [Discostella pseudostelligera]|uniref:PABS domain-containing protein n=1 Tax=Discostella pseudostelligera TaxID=259834 RepID=A0ABD3M6Z7_9STRA
MAAIVYCLFFLLLINHYHFTTTSALRLPSTTTIITPSSSLKMSTDNNNTSDFPPPADYSHLIIDGWFHERGTLWPGQSFALQIKEVLYHKPSQFQDVLVFESVSYGRVLVLDGVIQVTERDELSYQEMMAHLPLYAHPNPQRVLVIGGGDGGVLREIARHTSVTEIVICELDPDVIAVSKKYLPFVAKGFDDPRVKVHVMDGAQFMKEHQSSFDVIITDSSDPVGPASVLFETPFYKAMHDSLRDGGIICTQGECVWLHVDLIQRLIKAITPLFSSVEYAYCTIPSYPSGQIGFVIATKKGAAVGGKKRSIDGEDKEEEVVGCKSPVRVPTEAVQKELRYYTPEMHRAAFVLPAFAKRAIFGDDE